MIDVQKFSERYDGLQLNMKAFQEMFRKNGSGNEYLRYVFEEEDIAFLGSSYERDDPRFYDYVRDDDDSDDGNDDDTSDPPDEDWIDQLPYPNLTIFVNVTEHAATHMIDDLTVCKVYSTGCFTPGHHSDTLTDGEAHLFPPHWDQLIDAMDKLGFTAGE